MILNKTGAISSVKRLLDKFNFTIVELSSKLSNKRIAH